MARLSKPCPERPELAAAISRAEAAYQAMTPEQKRAHNRAQRRSWVIGEMMLEHPDMTREQVEAILDRIERE